MCTVRIKLGTYENVDADCPTCGKTSRYNRVSDLKTTEPIPGKDVACLQPDCRQTFRIISDTINPRHEMLVYDCYDLIKEKRYAQCILNLCQAWECYFSLFLRVTLCYAPFSGQNKDINHINKNLQELYSKIKNWTYNPLRSAYAVVVGKYGKRVPSSDVDIVLANLANYKNYKIQCVVQSTKDPKWQTHLECLSKTKI